MTVPKLRPNNDFARVVKNLKKWDKATATKVPLTSADGVMVTFIARSRFMDAVPVDSTLQDSAVAYVADQDAWSMLMDGTALTYALLDRLFGDRGQSGLWMQDTFTRADSANNPGAEELQSVAWTSSLGTWGIQSDRLYCSAVDISGFATIELNTQLVDARTSITIAVFPSSVNTILLTFRLDADDDTQYYFLQVFAGVLSVWSWDDPSYTPLSAIAYVPVAGDTLTMEYLLDDIVVSVNGAVVMTVRNVPTAAQGSLRSGALISIGTDSTALRVAKVAVERLAPQTPYLHWVHASGKVHRVQELQYDPEYPVDVASV
jgi:hypothetical protein